MLVEVVVDGGSSGVFVEGVVKGLGRGPRRRDL